MKRCLGVIFIFVVSLAFLGCSKEKCEININTEDNKQVLGKEYNNIKEKIDFINEHADLSNYELVQKMEEDINNDDINDILELWVLRNEIGYNESGYVVIKDSNSNEVLTTIPCGMGSYEIKSIADINGDEIKDISISCNGGGNAVFWSEIYVYEDKKYTYVDLEKYIAAMNIEIKPWYGFKVYAMDKDTFLYTGIVIPEEERNKYINVMFREDGIPIEYFMNYISLPCEFKDIDNDGISEILSVFYVSGISHADTLMNVVEVIKYVDGEYKVISLQQDDSLIEKVNNDLDIDEIIDMIYENTKDDRYYVTYEDVTNEEFVKEISDKFYCFYVEDFEEGADDSLIIVNKETLALYYYTSAREIIPYIN